MLILYQQIEAMTVRLADSMGYVLRAGFVIVISLQVLLYGLWSGMVQIGRDERMKQAAGKSSQKRVRR
jgi:ATP/ADP translocase